MFAYERTADYIRFKEFAYERTADYIRFKELYKDQSDSAVRFRSLHRFMKGYRFQIAPPHTKWYKEDQVYLLLLISVRPLRCQ